ncbi:MAG: PepSY domain-containing protein [Cytophagales bacterium]
MTKASFQRYVRKAHRYLGVLLGIQFLFWTIGGLYFSWTKIEEVRGENLRRKESLVQPQELTISLADVLPKFQADSISKLSVSYVLGEAHYQITYFQQGFEKITLIHAATGAIRKPLNESEAVEVAKQSFLQPATVSSVAYITKTNGHHEYREKPLPAYAVTLSQPGNTTVYVSAELGTVQSYRNNTWRIFDFLWMLHIMDFENRDNINNWLLRAFSAFGLITLLSGFTLYFITSRKIIFTK